MLPIIDVHGMTKEQALRVVSINMRAFYDQGFPDCTIIHGHGQGILKKNIRALLKQTIYVKSMASDSNDGATIAYFE